MKTTLCLLMLSFASISFADCITTYNAGVMASKKGDNASNRAQNLFNEMKSLAANGASSEELCTLGKESRMSAFVAAQSYKNSRESFLEAVNACASPNDAKAASLADQATDAYNTSAEFITSMDNLLASKCNAKPLTPLLN